MSVTTKRDADAIVTILIRAGIPFTRIDPAEDAQSEKYPSGSFQVLVEDGYSGFFSEFTFDANGKLLRLAAWE